MLVLGLPLLLPLPLPLLEVTSGVSGASEMDTGVVGVIVVVAVLELEDEGVEVEEGLVVMGAMAGASGRRPESSRKGLTEGRSAEEEGCSWWGVEGCDGCWGTGC